MEGWHLIKERIPFHKFLKRKIYEKRGGSALFIKYLNLFYYNKNKKYFYMQKFIFWFTKIFFPQKRNKIMKGQVVVIFIFKKQGKTKRKHSEGKNFMIYLTIDWSRSEPLSLLHYFHLKVQKVSITAERISNRSVALTVLFLETKTMHKTQKLHIIQRVLHHAQWFPHKSFFFLLNILVRHSK
jgi:hypothetical protein